MTEAPPRWEGEVSDEGRPAVADSRRSSLLVAAGILLSRIAGLVREVAIAGYLGAGAAARHQGQVELRGSDTELTALLAEPQATVEGVEAADCP